MPAKPKRKILLAKSTCRRGIKITHDFAASAYRFRFRSPDILELKEMSPDKEIARVALVEARPPSLYVYQDLNSILENFTEIFD